MPGTILVSGTNCHALVIQSSRPPVSMGKIEYQISDKGNFSFPLTSLRDDLIVKIQDAGGNEIARTGIHVRLILEKGVWEDIFTLGEGHLHLKLQFILNDEERDRIRIMRQSALKKKHDELLRSSRRGRETDSSTVISNAALPFRTNDEVSDQYKSTKPVLQAANLTPLQHKGKKPANQSPSEKQPQGVVNSEEMAIMLGSSEQIDAVKNELMQYSEKRSTPARTPSNVRKMISAFESDLAKDMRPHIKPPPTKYQSSKIETKDSSKTQHLQQDKSRDTEPADILQERVKSAKQLKELSTINILNKPTDSNARNELDKYYSYESSGVWIFPDESRKSCITTSGKSVMGIVESQDTNLSHQRSLDSSKLENMEKNAAHVGTGSKGRKFERVKETRGSKTSGSDDNGDENSGGPVNQVIKVAIIVGFGILVLLTRQRKNR